MKNLLFISFLVFSVSGAWAQDTAQEGKIRVVGEDSSTPGYILNDVVITTDNSAYQKKYRTTKYFVRRVYAYAELAAGMLLEYEDTLSSMTSERQKKKFVKRANKELKEEFGEEIKEMSVTRGIYLNKLIYRYSGMSTYDIIKDYRGGMQAMFWQSLCKLNGQDLKVTYDPEGEDMVMERVVQEIEAGEIKIVPRPAKSDKGKEVEQRNTKRKFNLFKRKDSAVTKH